MRHHMMLSGANQLENVYFEQDNALSNAGFSAVSGSNVTSVTEGVSGDYYYFGHWSSPGTSGYTFRYLAVVIEPSASKPINVGDKFKLTGDVEYSNASAFHPDFDQFTQQATVRTFSVAPPDVSTITNSTQVFSSTASYPHGSNINSPIGTLNEEFTIGTGEDKAIRLYFSFAIAEEYDPGEPNFVDPYVGTQIKNIKLEVISRA